MLLDPKMILSKSSVDGTGNKEEERMDLITKSVLSSTIVGPPQKNTFSSRGLGQ